VHHFGFSLHYCIEMHGQPYKKFLILCSHLTQFFSCGLSLIFPGHNLQLLCSWCENFDNVSACEPATTIQLRWMCLSKCPAEGRLQANIWTAVLNPTFIFSHLTSFVVVVAAVVVVDVVFIINDNQFVRLSDIVIHVLSLFLLCP